MEGADNKYITEEMREFEPTVQHMFITIKSGDY